MSRKLDHCRSNDRIRSVQACNDDANIIYSTPSILSMAEREPSVLQSLAKFGHQLSD